MIRVHIIESPTNAPAAILRTTGKMKASTGDRSTKMYLIFTVPQRICLCRKVRYINRQIPKGIASKLKLWYFLRKGITVAPY